MSISNIASPLAVRREQRRQFLAGTCRACQCGSLSPGTKGRDGGDDARFVRRQDFSDRNLQSVVRVRHVVAVGLIHEVVIAVRYPGGAARVCHRQADGVVLVVHQLGAVVGRSTQAGAM